MEEVKNLLEDFHKVGLQRAFAFAALAAFFDKVTDDPDIIRVKLAILQTFMDNVMDKGIVLEDDIEQKFLKCMQDWAHLERDLESIKDALEKGEDPL